MKATAFTESLHNYEKFNSPGRWKRSKLGFPGGASGKETACQKKKKKLLANAGDIRDVGSIPGLGRSPGEGNGKPLQYSCLENPMDRGAWWAIVHGVAKSQIRLSD